MIGHDNISANNPLAGVPPHASEDFMHGVVGEYFAPLMCADRKKNDWGSVDLFDGRVVRRMFAVWILGFPGWRGDVPIVHGRWNGH